MKVDNPYKQASIVVPERLWQVLERDRESLTMVTANLPRFEEWFEAVGMPFFPEYTDHGTRHIQGVLNTASSLIKDEAWSLITPNDAAVLVIATILHDAAMHLSEDGFLELLNTVKTEPQNPSFDKQTWPELWEEFLAEVSRYDGKKLKEVFSTDKPIKWDSNKDVGDWTTNDKKLIGEFIRRYHPRLAHEFAIEGVPGSHDRRMHLRDISGELTDLSGLIARSHGVEIRDTLEYLDEKFGPRTFQGVHAVYLMALLRTSDYLQVQAERAPKTKLAVQALRVPLSQREFKFHHAIVDITAHDEDPEAIRVTARPTDVGTFLKIRKWSIDIQRELDVCWAVLGERFGRYDEMAKLGLTIRRVKSNLDNVNKFAGTVDFVPTKATFEAADVELLKLLIYPLYGDRPEIGARELIQNAVDAVREKWRLRPDLELADLKDEEPDVLVVIEAKEDNTYWFTISDRGIGMTEQVVRNYFLRAGASFRSSDRWKRNFEKDGHSTVARSGRFGVGALASFLLGNQLEVETCHVNSCGYGVRFLAELDSDLIELKRTTSSVGTRVRIKITKEVFDRLIQGGKERYDIFPFWCWYVDTNPRLDVIVIKGNDGGGAALPGNAEDVCRDFTNAHEIEHEEYESIQWTYSRLEERYNRNSVTPMLVCNGLCIESDWSHYVDKLGPFAMPRVRIVDSDGNLPLDLTRGRADLATWNPRELLFRDICCNYIAYLFTGDLIRGERKRPLQSRREYRGFLGSTRERSSLWEPYFTGGYVRTSEGLTYPDERLLYLSNVSSIVLLTGDVAFKSNIDALDKRNVGVARLSLNSGVGDSDTWLRRLYAAVGSMHTSDDTDGDTKARWIEGARVLVPRVYEQRISAIKSSIPKYVARAAKKVDVTPYWEMWEFGRPNSVTNFFQDVINRLKVDLPTPQSHKELGNNNCMVAELSLNFPENGPEASKFADYWMEFVGMPHIPMNEKETEHILARASNRLKHHMKWYIEIQKAARGDEFAFMDEWDFAAEAVSMQDEF